MFKLKGMNRLLDKIFSCPLIVPKCEKTESKLAEDRSVKLFNYRCWQLKNMGIPEVTVVEVAQHLNEAELDSVSYSKNPTPFEYVFNHHSGKEEAKNRWYDCMTSFGCRQWRKLISWPPFAKNVSWKVKKIKLSDLKDEPPPGLMLRLLETKFHSLFNSYGVMIAREANKIVLVGEVWELKPTFGSYQVSYNDPGQIAHFYLGEWSLS